MSYYSSRMCKTKTFAERLGTIICHVWHLRRISPVLLSLWKKTSSTIFLIILTLYFINGLLATHILFPYFFCKSKWQLSWIWKWLSCFPSSERRIWFTFKKTCGIFNVCSWALKKTYVMYLQPPARIVNKTRLLKMKWTNNLWAALVIVSILLFNIFFKKIL